MIVKHLFAALNVFIKIFVARALSESSGNMQETMPNLKRVRFTSTNGSVNCQYHRKLLELNILEYEVKLLNLAAKP